MTLHLVDGSVTGDEPAKRRYRTAAVDGRSIRVRVLNADLPPEHRDRLLMPLAREEGF